MTKKIHLWLVLTSLVTITVSPQPPQWRRQPFPINGEGWDLRCFFYFFFTSLMITYYRLLLQGLKPSWRVQWPPKHNPTHPKSPQCAETAVATTTTTNNTTSAKSEKAAAMAAVAAAGDKWGLETVTSRALDRYVTFLIYFIYTLLNFHSEQIPHHYSALKSGPVLVLLPILEGPRTGPVPESFRIQEPQTGTAKKTAKKCKKPVITAPGMNTVKCVLDRQKSDMGCNNKL
jgi:hypothetical protein